MGGHLHKRRIRKDKEMSEEFKPFDLRIETAEEANFIGFFLHWVDELYPKALESFDAKHTYEQWGIEKLFKSGFSKTPLYRRLPDELQYNPYGVNTIAPTKIGCNDIQYHDGYLMAEGQKVTLEQAEAMVKKMKGEDDG